MATAQDTASYIISRLGAITAMKLEKLLYYAQAWSLVRDDRPLFPDRIEAWANGPVVPAVYRHHRKQFMVGPRWPHGSADALDQTARDTVDAVLEFYGAKSADWLSQLSHREPPWLDARRGLESGESGRREISHAAMAEYYGSLV